MAIYSTRFIAGVMDAAVVYQLTYTVPAGMVAIIKNIDLVGAGFGGFNALYCSLPGELLFARVNAGKTSGTAQWKGRVIALADEVVTVDYSGNGNAGVVVTGYLLTA